MVSQVCQINFYINEIYNYSAWVGLHYSYQQIFKNLDKGVFEFFGPTGLAKIYLFVTRLFSKIYEAGLGRHVIVIYTTLFMYFILFELFL